MFGGNKKKSRNLLAGAATAALGLVGGAAATNATVTFDVIVSGVSGTGVTMVNNKSVTVSPSAAGGVITFDLNVAIAGSNTNTKDDGFQTANFRFTSPNVSGGVVRGALAPADTQWTATFGVAGAPADPNGGLPLQRANGTLILDGNGDPQPMFNPITLPVTTNDLDGDGDTDLGGTSTNVDTNNGNVRASAVFKGLDFKLYRFQMTIGSVLTSNGTSAKTQISMDRASNILWFQDNANRTSTALPAQIIVNTTLPTITLDAPAAASSISIGTPGTVRSDSTDGSDNDVATAGSVHVTGSLANGYVSEIDGLTSNAPSGSATIDLPAGIAAPVYAMLWINDGTGAATPTEIANLKTELDAGAAGLYTVVTAANADSSYTGLQLQYSGFNMLVKFTGAMGGNQSVNWDFSGQAGLVLDKIAIVPEPTAAAAFLMPALGLVGARRRRRA